MRILLLALGLVALGGCKTTPEPLVKEDPVEVPTGNQTIRLDCDAGNAGSCLMMGVRYERGENVNRDMDKAFEFYERSCRLGSSHGCYSKALVLLYERDNPIQALSFLEYGCDQAKHGPSCVTLGDVARDGIIYPRDEREALRRYGQACETGYHRGCNAYIRHIVYASQQLVSLADYVRWLEANCEAGHDMSCNEAADLYLLGEEWGTEVVQADRKKAEAFHAKASRAARTHILVDAQVSPPPQEMPVRDVSPRSEPPPFEPGYVVVSGQDGGSIVVDGVDTQKTSPATVTIFVGGRHVVQLRGKDGVLGKAKHVWIDSAGRVELHFE